MPIQSSVSTSIQGSIRAFGTLCANPSIPLRPLPVLDTLPSQCELTGSAYPSTGCPERLATKHLEKLNCIRITILKSTYLQVLLNILICPYVLQFYQTFYFIYSLFISQAWNTHAHTHAHAMRLSELISCT